MSTDDDPTVIGNLRIQATSPKGVDRSTSSCLRVSFRRSCVLSARTFTCN
jgi:hypothetical protein